MAEESVDPNHQKCILGNLAANEAALDVEIEMALQRYEALYHNLKMKDTEIAAKEDKNKQFDELIDAKKNELDGVVNQREEVRKRTTSLRLNVENSQKLLVFYEEDRIKRQEERKSIVARYQELIDRKKEKINSYPLVVERNKLRNELLAARVELGVLKYRNTVKKKQEKQMKEIKTQLLNKAIVKLAQSFVNARKLEEKLKLQQELKKMRNSSIAASEKVEDEDERNVVETTVTDLTNSKLLGLDSQEAESLSKDELQTAQTVPSAETNEIDGVLKSFRAKLQVRMRSSPVLLPPVLSIEKQANNSKSNECEKSEQLVTSNTKETSIGMENAALNRVESPKASDKECSNQNGSGEVLPRRDESAKGSDKSNEPQLTHESNMRLRNALIATQSRNKASNSPGGKKRILLQKTTQHHSVKYMRRTDDLVTAKKLPDNYQYPLSSNATDPGRSGKLYKPVAQNSTVYYSHGKPSVRKIHDVGKIQKKLECPLPEDTEMHPTTKESNVVRSTYFNNETAIERNEQVLPVPIQGYTAYDECDQNEPGHEDDEPNPNERMYSTRGAAEKLYPNRNIVASERRNVGEAYVAANDEYPAQFELSDENGAVYEEYSDPNDEIDADGEHPGTHLKISTEPPMNRGVGGFQAHPSSDSSKDRQSSYEGMFSGMSNPRSFNQDLFAGGEGQANHNSFGNMFGANLDNSNSPKNLPLF